MEHEITQTIHEKLKTMPLEQQEKLLEFITEQAAGESKKDHRAIWEVIVEMSSEIPDEMWAELPTDGSLNHDHYLYGAPKKSV